MTHRKVQGIRRAAVALSFAAAAITAGAQTAVDDAALAGPRADGQWLTYGGDYAETRFSTLDGINAGNVDRLALAFSVEVGSEDARLEATPLVVDGMLYGTTTWNVIFAIDLRTQSLKWRWDPGIVRPARLWPGQPWPCVPRRQGLRWSARRPPRGARCRDRRDRMDRADRPTWAGAHLQHHERAAHREGQSHRR